MKIGKNHTMYVFSSIECVEYTSPQLVGYGQYFERLYGEENYLEYDHFNIQILTYRHKCTQRKLINRSLRVNFNKC